jgi:hypothetical protein
MEYRVLQVMVLNSRQSSPPAKRRTGWWPFKLELADVQATILTFKHACNRAIGRDNPSLGFVENHLHARIPETADRHQRSRDLRNLKCRRNAVRLWPSSLQTKVGLTFIWYTSAVANEETLFMHAAHRRFYRVARDVARMANVVRATTIQSNLKLNVLPVRLIDQSLLQLLALAYHPKQIAAHRRIGDKSFQRTILDIHLQLFLNLAQVIGLIRVSELAER